jgi:hypothetical protein
MGYVVGDQYVNDNDPGGYVMNGVYIPRRKVRRRRKSSGVQDQGHSHQQDKAKTVKAASHRGRGW